MRPTVPTAASDRPVTEDSTLAWITGEAQKLFQQLRRAANYTGQDKQTAASDGTATWTTVYTSAAMPSDATWQVEADIVGVSTSGAAQRASYRLIATVESTAGTVAAVGANQVVAFHETAAACDARIAADASARTVTVDALDDGTSPMMWTAVVSINEGLTA